MTLNQELISEYEKNQRPGFLFGHRLATTFGMEIVDLSFKNHFFITIYLWFGLFRQIWCCRERRIYFYNFPIHYLPVYFFYLLIFWRRPSLLLADGVNCFGLRLFRERLFLSLFDKIICLPSGVGAEKPNITWFPGFFPASLPAVQQEKTVKPYFVFNSNFLKYNGIDDFLKFVADNPTLEVVVTGSAARYILGTEIRYKNISMLPDLDYKDYLKLVHHSMGVLLFRDETFFENKYNFPSKLFEAFSLGVPVVSLYPISGAVPDGNLQLGDSTFLKYYRSSHKHFMELDLMDSLHEFIKE